MECTCDSSNFCENMLKVAIKKHAGINYEYYSQDSWIRSNLPENSWTRVYFTWELITTLVISHQIKRKQNLCDVIFGLLSVYIRKYQP